MTSLQTIVGGSAALIVGVLILLAIMGAQLHFMGLKPMAAPALTFSSILGVVFTLSGYYVVFMRGR